MLLAKRIEKLADCYQRTQLQVIPALVRPCLHVPLLVAPCPTASRTTVLFLWPNNISIMILNYDKLISVLFLATKDKLCSLCLRGLELHLSPFQQLPRLKVWHLYGCEAGSWGLPMLLGCHLLARSLVTSELLSALFMTFFTLTFCHPPQPSL